jgi:hypothetical protein
MGGMSDITTRRISPPGTIVPITMSTRRRLAP